jgi:uncharacterized protein YdcH (DUF465 family)
MKFSSQKAGWLLSAAVFTVVGCGQLETAKVVTKDVSGLEMRNFRETQLEFTNNRFFFWKKERSAESTAVVIKVGKRLSEIEDSQALLSQAMARVDKKFVTILGSENDRFNTPRLVLNGQKALTSAKDKVTSLEKSKKELSDKVSEAEMRIKEIEALPVPSDQTELEKLLKEKKSLQDQIAQQNKQIASTVKVLEKTNKTITDLSAKLKPYEESGLESDLIQWQEHQASYDTLAVESLDVAPEMEQHVSFASPESSFKMNITAQGSVSKLDVSGFDINKFRDADLDEVGAPTEFHTSDSSIGPVAYEPKGGILTFEIQTLNANIWFRIARWRYNAPDGLKRYKGDMVYCGLEKGGFGRPIVIPTADGRDANCGSTSLSAKAVRRPGVVILGEKAEQE